MKSFCLVVMVLALVALSAGCEGEKPQSPNAPTAGAYVNTVCPIMGNPINAANVPASLTREFKGQKVAFCCAGCPGQWDALSDEDKAAKLAAAAVKKE